MNKETIYIEPSDDITDVLSKIKASDKKIIALVPPKKPTVLLSSINIKLLARTAKAEKKAVVLVSTDDSLVKLAMAAEIPVAQSLKSRPVLANADAAKPSKAESEDKEKPKDAKKDDIVDDVETAASEDTDDGEDEDEPVDSEDDELEDNEEDDKDEDEEADDEEDNDGEEGDDPKPPKSAKEKPEKKDKKAKKDKGTKKQKEESSSPFVNFLRHHVALIIIAFVFVLGLAGFLVWALTFAPSVNVAIKVRSSSANFSENVIFTSEPADEDSSIGKFYAHEEKLEKTQTIKFTATGKKDIGEAASGKLVVVGYFSGAGESISIPADSKFTFGSLDYYVTEGTTINGPERLTPAKAKEVCDNYNDDFDFENDTCQVSSVVSIVAAAPGEDYNVSSASSEWTSHVSGVSAYNTGPISGGTSNVVTVVQQSDVDVALDKMKNESASDGKQELMDGISKSVLLIDASYKVDASDPQVTPAVGEEVKEGTTPQITSKTVYSVLSVDSVRIEEFIKAKATLDEGKKLYSVGNPFIEYFVKSGENTYSAKLKTTYKYGPEISETEVLDIISGQKIGRIEPTLKDAFGGISSVSIDKSYFWVNSVPDNPNQVHINIEVEE